MGRLPINLVRKEFEVIRLRSILNQTVISQKKKIMKFLLEIL